MYVWTGSFFCLRENYQPASLNARRTLRAPSIDGAPRRPPYGRIPQFPIHCQLGLSRFNRCPLSFKGKVRLILWHAKVSSLSPLSISSLFLPSESSGGSISGLLLNLLPDSSQEQPPRLYVRAEWASLVITILVFTQIIWRLSMHTELFSASD